MQAFTAVTSTPAARMTSSAHPASKRPAAMVQAAAKPAGGGAPGMGHSRETHVRGESRNNWIGGVLRLPVLSLPAGLQHTTITHTTGQRPPSDSRPLTPGSYRQPPFTAPHPLHSPTTATPRAGCCSGHQRRTGGACSALLPAPPAIQQAAGWGAAAAAGAGGGGRLHPAAKKQHRVALPAPAAIAAAACQAEATPRLSASTELLHRAAAVGLVRQPPAAARLTWAPLYFLVYRCGTDVTAQYLPPWMQPASHSGALGPSGAGASHDVRGEERVLLLQEGGQAGNPTRKP